MSLPERLALIDVETTGAHPLRDRITEIAILRIEAGQLVERWESLVRPGIPIPPTIQRFTGISDEMVADAPDFAEIADSVRALLDGCVFVAHNARFDFGFIKQAFQQIGEEFDAPVLCTVKLSRALYPEHHRHGLDALIERHGLVCSARHRAMGDIEALWQFLQQATETFPPERIAAAVSRAMKAPARPPGLPDGVIEALPDTPGVYLFFGETGSLPLYVGKSINLRSRVMDHFSASTRDGKEAEIARQVRHVEWIETGGELGALLLEAELVKTRKPLMNRQLRSNEEVFALALRPGRKRPPILERVPITGADPLGWGELFGCFRNRREADNMLRELALLYKLCPRRLGLEPGGSGACMAFQLKRCAGVCAGRETTAEHDQRLAAALRNQQLRAWPWPGPVVVSEQHAASGISRHHLLDHWCHLGSVTDEAALTALIEQPPPRRFDLDVYRMLLRWFDAPAHRTAARPL